MAITKADIPALIQEIADREFTTAQLASLYECTVDDLRSFVEEHKAQILRIRQSGEQMEEVSTIEQSTEDEEEQEEQLSNVELTPTELDELWITKKAERMRRYQVVCDGLYMLAAAGSTDATVLRELRSYMRYAADELGQLLHRGAGMGTDAEEVRYSIAGVDMDDLK